QSALPARMRRIPEKNGPERWAPSDPALEERPTGSARNPRESRRAGPAGPMGPERSDHDTGVGGRFCGKPGDSPRPAVDAGLPVHREGIDRGFGDATRRPHSYGNRSIARWVPRAFDGTSENPFRTTDRPSARSRSIVAAPTRGRWPVVHSDGAAGGAARVW